MTPKTKPVSGLPMHRLETLADGVFAIVMTILVLDLRLPETVGPGGLASDLVALWPRFATYVISFIVLGIYWFAHHQVFFFLARVNRTIVWLNILFFMGVAITPFAASLLGSHPDDLAAVAFYGVLLGLLSLLGYAIWRYMTGDRGLVEAELDPILVKKIRLWFLGGPAVVPLAIGLFFVNPFLSLLVYLVLPAIYVFFNPVDRYLAELREEAAE
ncbi:MAG: TMEM175 family protein [Methanobacteriota archaeon]